MCYGKALSNQLVAYDNTDIHVMSVDHKIFTETKPNTGLLIDTKGIW